MKIVAHDIIVENELKTDFILDDYGNPTENTYQFKEYKIIDIEGNVLEVCRYTQDTITKDEICETTGLKLGFTYYIFD
jgi:hypothetical protein